jgi:hypothetical protein
MLCKQKVAIIVASVLLVSSFTFSSCKKCSKGQPGRDGSTNNKPKTTDISTLKQQIQCQLGKMAAQLVLVRNVARRAEAADSAVTDKSNKWVSMPERSLRVPVSIAKEPEVENAKRLAEMAENANTEAQNFAVTADQKEAAQADTEAMILVKAVGLVSAQITAQVASARGSLKHILYMQVFNAGKVALYALDDEDRHQLEILLGVEHWYSDASAENWNKVDQYASRLAGDRRRKAINDMKIYSQARLKSKAENACKLAAQESKKASDAVKKLEGEVGQAVLNMVKAAVTQAEK